MTQPAPIPILVLCRDLLFGSKITAAAKSGGVAIQMLRDPSRLASPELTGKALVVDLTQPGFTEAAAEWKTRTGGKVVGFAGHADVETIAKARVAGVDQVLTRGEFSGRVAGILSEIGRDA